MANYYLREQALEYLGVDEKEFTEIMERLGFPVEKEEDMLIVEITPDRPDMLSLRGMKRAIDLWNGKRIEVKKKKGKLSYSNSFPKNRPYIAMAIVRNISLNEILLEDIIQFQEKLHATLGRKRKKLAIGIHDFDKTKPNYSYVEGGNERFIPLNSDKEMSLDEIIEKTEKGKEYGKMLKKPYQLVLDEEGIISFPPIINADRTALTENSKNLLIEVTGIEEFWVLKAVELIAETLAYPNGEIELLSINGEYKPSFSPFVIDVKEDEIDKLLGKKIKEKEKHLAKMGIEMQGEKAIIPSYRVDVMDYTDIAEDLAIAVGYNEFISDEFPQFYSIGGRKDREIERISDIFVRLGFIEVKNFVLRRFSGIEKLRVLNPVSELTESFQYFLYPTLLETLRKNTTSSLPIKIFEVSHAYQEREKIVIGFAIADKRLDVNEGKKVLETLAYELSLPYKIENATPISEHFTNGRFGRFQLGNYVGFIGEISPKTLAKLNLKFPVLVAEFVVKEYSEI